MENHDQNDRQEDIPASGSEHGRERAEGRREVAERERRQAETKREKTDERFVKWSQLVPILITIFITAVAGAWALGKGFATTREVDQIHKRLDGVDNGLKEMKELLLEMRDHARNSDARNPDV